MNMDALPAMGGMDEATVRFDRWTGNTARGEMLIEESDYPLQSTAKKR
ncbi:hypothetical protein [Mesorhizobium waimense]|nr:hypothetical protein [Mesorhizobium waimense]